MFNLPSGNHASDLLLLLLQALGLGFFSLVIALPRRFSQAHVRWAAILVVLIAPAVWATAFPQRGGIEGAARLMLAVPLVTFNLMLAFAAYLRTKRR
ncbi:MAG: hypothetical protein JNL62_14935 [Bryobacterales bacterium]|nr:hypothetical protein [Bryobacterales bacterium]